MSAIEELVNYTEGLSYEDLPQQVVEVVKKSILNTLSATIGGSSAQGPKKLVHLIREWGGRAEGTILVYGNKVPLPNAACANSAMSRGFDFDETCEGGGHVSATIVPAAIAICEYSEAFKNKKINGRDLIVAVTLGNELTCRLRLAGKGGTGFTSGWLAEPFACLAVAAIGGKLLGFGSRKIHNALGISYFQCFGNIGAAIGENGGLMAALGQGLATKAGVLSVLFADRGFTATKEILDGKFGLYRMYGNGEYDPKILVAELGKRFDLLNTSIKPYPGCAATTAPIYGALELVREYNIRPEHVVNIRLKVGEFTYGVCGEGKRKPSNPVDALWNYSYSTAVALVKRKVCIDDFTEEAIRNPRVLDLLQRVTIEVDPDKFATKTSEIEIMTKDGMLYKKAVDFPKGHFMNPMSGAELNEKFRSCNRFSEKPLPEESVEKLIQMVNELEEMDNVTRIVSMLS